MGFPKPTIDKIRWEPAGGDQVEPAVGKKSLGWLVNEKPPSQYFNFMMHEYYLWDRWLDERFVDPNGDNAKFGIKDPETSEALPEITLDTGKTGINLLSPITALHVSGIARIERAASAPLQLSETSAGTDLKNWQILSIAGMFKVERLDDTFATASSPLVINSSSEVTLSNKLTVTAGGLTVTAGGIDVDAGGINVDVGGISVKGGLTVVDTGLTVTAGGIDVDDGGISVDAGGISVTGNSSITGTLDADGTITSRSIKPDDTDLYDLGLSTKRYKGFWSGTVTSGWGLFEQTDFNQGIVRENLNVRHGSNSVIAWASVKSTGTPPAPAYYGQFGFTGEPNRDGGGVGDFTLPLAYSTNVSVFGVVATLNTDTNLNYHCNAFFVTTVGGANAVRVITNSANSTKVDVDFSVIIIGKPV
jgi:hypothetical protein